MPVSERCEAQEPSALGGALIAERTEAKYLLEHVSADALRARVAARLASHHHSVPPGFGFETAPVHITTTTYFDTARRVLYRAAISLPVHLKVRARQYRDEPSSQIEAPIFIELKERNGARSRKQRAALDTAEAARLFAALAERDGSATQRACEALVRAGADPARGAVLRELAETRLSLGAALEPSCVVRYRREAFQDPYGTLRVTFDRDIEAFRAPLGLAPPVFRECSCVVETKSAGPLPSWLSELLTAHGARATEYSKLVMASRAVHGPL